MTVKDFITLVQETRQAQELYQKTPAFPDNMKSAALNKKLTMENKLDVALKTIRKDVAQELQNTLW
jgi:hypothetical protein